MIGEQSNLQNELHNLHNPDFMEIRRFFVQPQDILGDSITIDGDEFYHMTKVLRYKIGYKAIVCANDGREHLCTIESMDKTHAVLHIDDTSVQDEKHYHVTLYAGLLKNNKLDFAIQKAVELGVDEIVPFVSHNSAENKFAVERANKIALESAKQCGSVFLTNVKPLVDFDTMLDECKQYDTVLFAYEGEKKKRIKDCSYQGKNIALIVGCEGGFTLDEVDMAKECGANIITLGRRILRAESASIVASALLLDTLGELDYD